MLLKTERYERTECATDYSRKRDFITSTFTPASASILFSVTYFSVIFSARGRNMVCASLSSATWAWSRRNINMMYFTMPQNSVLTVRTPDTTLRVNCHLKCVIEKKYLHYGWY